MLVVFDPPPRQPRHPHRIVAARILLVLGVLASLTSWVSPAVALAGGATLGLTLGDPLRGRSRQFSGWVLKVSVVGLGFGLSLPAVMATGRSGLALMATGITVTLTLGALLGWWLHVDPTTSTMISGGTAICGGSAIAALAPALCAGASSIGVAMATVFLLNGAALYTFPAVGHLVGLSQEQFGVWAAVAIHDTSSVVGAAAQYGDRALELATVLKLTRALWIVPLVGSIALWRRRSTGATGTRISVPWFIGLFVLAAGLRGLFPGAATVFNLLEASARHLLVLALFLVGVSLTRQTLREVGVRPLLQGTALWGVMAAGSLAVVVAMPHLAA